MDVRICTDEITYNYFDIPITQTLIHFLIYQIDWIVLVCAQNDQK